MARRVCAQPGCPTITTRTRCSQHEREHDRARGRRQARGYNRDYDRAVREMHASAPTNCVICLQAFTPDNPATGGHRTAQRHGGTTANGIEPQCRRCNYGWRRTGT